MSRAPARWTVWLDMSEQQSAAGQVMNNLPREYLIETDVAPAARMGAAPRRVPTRGGAVGVARGVMDRVRMHTRRG